MEGWESWESQKISNMEEIASKKKAPSSKASGKCSKAILHSGKYLKLMNLAFHLFEVKNKFKRLKMGDSVMFDQI